MGGLRGPTQKLFKQQQRSYVVYGSGCVRRPLIFVLRFSALFFSDTLFCF